MKVLVLGKTGQLARHLAEEMPGATFWGRTMLDLSTSSIKEQIESFKPTFIINAAAYTAVDKAESERMAAWAVNARASALIAEAANALGAPLVHLSTDYVFDGSKKEPYTPDDPTCPISVYGATKLAGELAVRTLCEHSWILRTSWVFSEYGHNFVNTILRLAATRDSLRVVADQFGTPTYAKDIARTIAGLVGTATPESPLEFGTYHATGGRPVSWHEFATRIVTSAHTLGRLPKSVPVAPISAAEFPTPARRPPNAVLLASTPLTNAAGTVFDWEEGLETALLARPRCA